MSTNIRLGISTCPNDTFAFHGLLTGAIETRGLDFQIELMDIQELNDGLFSNRFDVAKASFHAALTVSDTMTVLPSGSALGFGVGPLLLARQANSHPRVESQLTLCPGELTTATLLFRLFHPNTTRVRQVVFSEIMPDLISGDADFGVCIHEGRFTWQQQGLHLVEDLGERWHTETKLPLPLGGLLAQKSLSPSVLNDIQHVIRSSIEFGIANRSATLPTMRRYAQEFVDSVLMEHVDLYVNAWTIDLGDDGARSLAELSHRAKQIGLISPKQANVEVFSV